MKLNWGKSIVLFFIVFLSLAFAFIVFSFKHKPDLVSDNSYEEGAAYTKQIIINKRSAIFSDSINIKQNDLFVEFSFSPTIISKADSLRIHFYSPADKQKDYKLSFNNLTDSLKISNSHLWHGRYIVKIYWQMQNEKYYIEKDFFAK